MRLTEFHQSCPHCGGPSFSDLILAEKKDACYHKVKASAKVWPSAYASGRLVQCRKKGAANYGNNSESVAEAQLDEKCWDTHKQVGMKNKGGRQVPDCRPKESVSEGAMPTSVIRIKEKIRLMSDAEKKEYFRGKTQEQLQQMARRHGYGENSNVYAKYATQGLNEFAPGAGGDDEAGDDPYKYPKPESYRRSADYFEQFEADHFDREDFDDDTGVFKGYWGSKQIAYFKFDNPAQTGGDDPGMGWYYEPQSDGSSDNSTAAPAVDNADERKQQELSMISQFLKSGNRPNPDSQIGRLMKKHGLAEGSVTKKPQPYNEPNRAKKLSKETLDAIAGPRYKKDKKEQSVAEDLNEFAPYSSDDGGDDGFSDDTLKQLAAQWWQGDEDPRVEQTLAAAGWEIGQDEGYDNEPGVFVVQAGDINGRSYISWPAHELEGLAEATDPEIEEMYEAMQQLAEEIAVKKGVSVDLVWESFEALDDHMLYETAAWRRKEGKSKKGGLNAKGVASYRRENPGSKLQMAVTTKPSKLKKGSKAAKRRKSFCARMGGVKGPMKKPNGKPTRKALALRKWNC